MTRSLGTLTLDLVAKTGGFEQGMDAAERTADRRLRAIERQAQERAKAIETAFRDMAQSVAAPLAAAFSVGAITAMVRETAAAADELAKLSQSTGVAVESLGRLQYAASLNNATNEQLAQSLAKLAKGATETAAGTGEARTAFAALNLEVKNADGSIKASDALLAEIADKFASHADGAEKSAIAQKLFGESGAALIPLLNAGSAGLREMGDEAAAFGVVMSEQAAKSAEQFNDNLTRLTAQATGFRNTIGNELIPVLAAASGELVAFGGAGSAANVAASALRTTLETVVILGANVAYVFRAVGTEIGGIAAQAAAVARGDFAGALAIGDMMKEDAAAARAELDAFEQRILRAGEAVATLGTTADSTKPKLNALTAAAAATGKAGKVAGDALGEFIEKLEAREIAAAARRQEEYGEAVRAMTEPLERQAAALEEQLATYGMTEAAIQRTTLARLEEVRALAAANGATEDYLANVDREIAARRRIVEAGSSLEALKANENAAAQAADQWNDTARTIEGAIYDAIVSGGEDAGDVLQRTFKALVLEPVIRVAAQGLGGILLDALGLGGSGGAGGNGLNLLNLALNGYSAFSNSSIAAQFLGGSMSGVNALGTMYGNATGTGIDGLVGATGGWGTAPYSPGMGTYFAGLGGAMWAYNQTGSYTAGVAGGALGMAGAGAIAGGMGAAAAGTSVGAGAMAGAGAGLAAIPGWGWAALAGAAILGDLFKSEKNPRMSLQMASDPSTMKWEDQHKGMHRVTATGAFGTIGLAPHSKDIDAQDMTRMYQQIAAFDNTMAATMTADEIKTVRQAMDGWTSTRVKSKNSGSALEERNRAIADALGLDLGDVSGAEATSKALLNAVRVDDLQDAFGKVGQTLGRDSALAWIETLSRTETVTGPDGKQQSVEVDGFTEIAAALGVMRSTVYGNDADAAWRETQEGVARMFADIDVAAPRSIAEFQRLTEGIDLTTESGRTLYGQLAQLAPAFVQVASVVEQVFDAISTTTASSVRDIEMQVLDNAGKYAYLDAEVATLFEELAVAVDPATVQGIFEEINAATMTAFNLLDEGEQSRLADVFIDRLHEAEALAQERLSVVPFEDAVGTQKEAGEAMAAAAAAIKAAGTDQQAAAGALVEAAGALAGALGNIRISVDVAGAAEVGR